MSYLALNQAALHQLSHHWLFGLVRRPGARSLFDEQQVLASHSDNFSHAQATIARIAHYPRLVRGVYWLFNIANYRRNYYTLASFYAYQLYQQEYSMDSPNHQAADNIPTGVIFAAAIATMAAAAVVKPASRWLFTHLAKARSARLLGQE